MIRKSNSSSKGSIKIKVFKHSYYFRILEYFGILESNSKESFFVYSVFERSQNYIVLKGDYLLQIYWLMYMVFVCTIKFYTREMEF